MEPASTIYEAALLKLPKPSRRKLSHDPDNDLKPGQPGRIDLVVRRKDDGSVIVRTPADLGSPDAMLVTVKKDLESMTAEQFLNEWKMPVIN